MKKIETIILKSRFSYGFRFIVLTCTTALNS